MLFTFLSWQACIGLDGLRASHVRELHGMNIHSVKAMTSLISATVIEDSSTSVTWAVCLEDSSVREMPCSLSMFLLRDVILLLLKLIHVLIIFQLKWCYALHGGDW